MTNVDRYTRTAILLHWLIALLVLAQIAFGWYLQEIPRNTPDRSVYVNFHKSSGLVIGLLVVLRIAWRLVHTPPPMPASMPAWERAAARVNHGLLYGCLLIMPLSGYLGSNFSKFGIKLFNLWLLPPWGTDNRQIYALFNGLHKIAALVFVTLIAIHILAAMKHLILDRAVFRRMWPTVLLLAIVVAPHSSGLAAPFAHLAWC